MDSTRNHHTRKNSTPSRVSKQYQSPLQTLLQLGFQRHRAEKALAATGHRSAQLAADWLLAHVNDPILDLPSPREYIVYACPYGELQDQLEEFWCKSYLECGWNGSHNYMPHVTLVSFFKAPDECSLQLAQSLEQVVKQVLQSSKAAKEFPLEPYFSPNYIGLFVSEDNATILKDIAMQYVKDVSNSIINDNYEQLNAIATCFPWCTNPGSRFSILPKNIQTMSPEPNVKSLHLTLAYKFAKENFENLKHLAEIIIDKNLSTCWEIRLYSRDPRVVDKQIYKVVHEYTTEKPNELELRIGDYVYVYEDPNLQPLEGWVEGTSWLTGCSGIFPIDYTQKSAETDSWVLHKSVPLFERDHILEDNFLNMEEIRNSDNYTCDNASTISMRSTVAVPSNEIASHQCTNSEKEKTRGDIYIMRHGERVDFCFGNWISSCINANGVYSRVDLNMPIKLPTRHGYPESFKEDTPLTNVGVCEATLTGEGFTEIGVNIKYAFSSPALRCMQTCQGVLRGLGIVDEVPIKIEPGLFEWLTWYQPSSVPDWMTNDEFITEGFKLDASYEPYIDREKMKEYMDENCSEYYDRCTRTMQHILKTIGDEDVGNVLIVGHASTLDTCTRQLSGKKPRTVPDLNRIMVRVPYCSVVKFQNANNQWRVVDSHIPGVYHSMNKRFDWRVITTNE